MRRYIVSILVAIAALGVAPRGMRAQGDPAQIRVRVIAPGDSATRARRERLIMRFDSLRTEFERKRVDDADREALAQEMRHTVMALEESFGNVMIRRSATATGGGRATGDARMGGAITMRPRFVPRGYLGVSFDGPSIDEIRGRGERVIRFLEYPRIMMVEPSSPAERAGIAEGDTLVAFNGNDVRGREISLTRLLVPDQRIVVRVRREGAPRDFRVTVDEAPAYVMSRRAPMAGAAEMPMRFDMPRPRTPMPTPAVATAPMASVWIFNEGIGGAKLENISEGLGRALRTRNGVLVVCVAPGTPAYESGLRDGDVILAVSGHDVDSIRELRNMLMDDERENGARIRILRDQKKRDLMLRW